MNTLFLYDTKTMRGQINTNIFAGDNLITKINVQLPDNIGGYPKRECEYNLRAIIPEGNLSYIINPSQPYFFITNDITEKAQTVKLMMIITHEGNVIGRTNTVDLIVNEPAEAPDPPLTPREEFDEVIDEQRAKIAELKNENEGLEREVAEKDETISQQTEQITELSGEVTELTNENTRLENLTDTQRETIQNMLDNPPQPQLYTPPEPIVPESETRVYTPPQEYDGFASFVIKGTKLINPELSVFFKREVPIDLTFDQRVVFDYICCGNSAIRSINFSENVYRIGASSFANCTGVSEINFSVGLINILNDAFMGCSNLIQAILPHGLRRIDWRAFSGCTNLTTMFFPNSLTYSNEATMLDGCSKLQNVTLENGFNSNGLHLEASTLYLVDTIVGWLEALADRTGETARTLTMGTTNLNKLTNEQKAIAINKNWNLA